MRQYVICAVYKYTITFTDSSSIRASYGKPVDIWAIGCILGELSDGQVSKEQVKNCCSKFTIFVSLLVVGCISPLEIMCAWLCALPKGSQLYTLMTSSQMFVYCNPHCSI